MYRIAIPVTNWFLSRALDEEAVLAELRRAKATRVWLCTARGIEGETRLCAELEALARHKRFFEAHGLEVGAWLSSLGHGGPLLVEGASADADLSRYEKLVGLTGKTCEDSFCPSDPAFRAALSGWIARIAAIGIDLIMLDDDFRLSLRPNGNGCCCDRHMREYARRVGETLPRAQLAARVFAPKPNRFREAWMDMGRDALLGLAGEIRRRVDLVRPETRVGLCAVMTTWDVEGVSAVELARALAGSRARPFLRTIGAPYWSAVSGASDRLAYTVEITRLQRHWCENADIELFTEGDVYPRPRFVTPASFLEVFDTALRFSGGFDGILKYALDYTSSPRSETGYIDAMTRNQPVYDWIEAHAPRGISAGADVFCPMEKLRAATLPDGCDFSEVNARFFQSAAARLLSDNSVPVCYGTRNAHVVIGESAASLPLSLLDDGAVLDNTAARLLMARGVDVGVSALSAPETISGSEFFPEENEFVAVQAFRDFARVALAPGARALSTLNEHPVCWRYENAAGQRFAVYAFDMARSLPKWGATRGYSRQRQLLAALNWVGRKPLPAVCPGHPDLYLQAKETADRLVVGLWNLSCDAIYAPALTLAAPAASAAGFPLSARAEGTRLIIAGVLAPFAFTGVTVAWKKGE